MNRFIILLIFLYSMPALSQELRLENEPMQQETLPSDPVNIMPEIPVKQTFVPLPPEKPEHLLQKPSLSDSPTPQELVKDDERKPVDAVLDSTIPLPPEKPAFNLPVLDLPVPPSMEVSNPSEKEQEGIEESVAGGVEKQVDSVELACIKPEVMAIVQKSGLFFHAIPIVTSGYRSKGRKGSLHRQCMAVDFIVPSVAKETLVKYLRSLPEAGGVGTYCHTKSVHIDVGEARDWGYCGFRRTYFNMR